MHEIISYEEYHPYGTSAYRVDEERHRSTAEAVSVYGDGEG